MIKRDLAPAVLRLATQYPVVTITGPRQSGKSTLVKSLFPEHPYASLEDPDIRALAIQDPRGFFRRFPRGAVIDEAQRAPLLFSYLQTLVDERKENGQFILTGSAQFELLQSISQSLAGRTALARLMPFSMHELGYRGLSAPTLEDLLYRGFYPRIHDQNLIATEALSFYVNTYVERDVRQMINVRDLNRFETFVRLCAGRSGQVLNLSNLGQDCGINHNTAKAWLSILEASYLIFLLPAHSRNFSKRLVKSPKLYFYDPGLLCYLLGIEKPSQVLIHPLRGAIFESFVVSELVKQRFNAVRESNLFYFRDNVGHEIDVVADSGTALVPIEIKSSATYADDLAKGLRYYLALLKNPDARSCLIYGGDTTHPHAPYDVISYRDLSALQLDSDHPGLSQQLIEP